MIFDIKNFIYYLKYGYTIMFKSMLMAPSDPILGLSEIYKSDDRKNKINLGIGVYTDSINEAPILISVKNAEELLLKQETSKNYLNIEGTEVFNYSTQSLLFGKDNTIIPKNRIKTVQAPGGTGALRIISECITRNSNYKRRIWISDPTWINHKNIFLAAGLEVNTYPYYNKITRSINFDLLYSVLNTIKSGDIVLFHCCCHNPTGTDFTANQWNILSECAERRRWIPLFDLAYQGFDQDLLTDLTGLHLFCKNNPELIVCNSYSKNFGLYNERVGACTIVAENHNDAERVLSQLRSTIRSNYSNPPSHGASIVSTILQHETLRNLWENELKYMREHIKSMRNLLFHNLQNNTNKIINQDFNFIKDQKGMFAFMGLNNDQVMKLRKQNGIYLVESGRINLAGLSDSNIHRVCEALLGVYD